MSSVCVFTFMWLCISSHVSVVGGGGPALVYVNKLQACVRYTHIALRYLRINHPEPLIAQGRADYPECRKNLCLPGRRHYAYPPPPLRGCSPTALQSALQVPWGTGAPARAWDGGSSWATPLILPPPPPEVQGGNLYKHCTFELCVQSLTHTLAH